MQVAPVSSVTVECNRSRTFVKPRRTRRRCCRPAVRDRSPPGASLALALSGQRSARSGRRAADRPPTEARCSGPGISGGGTGGESPDLRVAGHHLEHPRPARSPDPTPGRAGMVHILPWPAMPGRLVLLAWGLATPGSAPKRLSFPAPAPSERASSQCSLSARRPTSFVSLILRRRPHCRRPVWQVFSQEPQLKALVCKSRHSSPHNVKPAGQEKSRGRQ